MIKAPKVDHSSNIWWIKGLHAFQIWAFNGRLIAHWHGKYALEVLVSRRKMASKAISGRMGDLLEEYSTKTHPNC